MTNRTRRLQIVTLFPAETESEVFDWATEDMVGTLKKYDTKRNGTRYVATFIDPETGSHLVQKKGSRWVVLKWLQKKVTNYYEGG